MNRTVYRCSVLMLIVVQGALAGQLRIGAPKVENDQIAVPVLLDGELSSGVASLNFTFTYDPAVLEPLAATVGSAAAEAGKQVQANLVAPGQYLVIMMGMNQSTVGAGEVAKIVLHKVGAGQAAQATIAIAKTTFASAEGVEIPSQGSQGVVALDAKTDGATESPSSSGPDATPTAPEPSSSRPGNPLTNGQPEVGTTNRGGAALTEPKVASETPTAGSTLVTPVAGAVAVPGTAKAGPAAAAGGSIEDIEQKDSGVEQLADAVQRVDAIRSSLPEQPVDTTAVLEPDAAPVAASVVPSGSQMPSGSAEEKTGNQGTVGDTISLAKVATPSISDTTTSQTKVESGVPNALPSTEQKSRTMKLWWVPVIPLAVLLGIVVLVRRKLFS